jgi:hypothetical protein
MDAYQMKRESEKLYNQASEIIDRALYLGNLGDYASYLSLMQTANQLNMQATEMAKKAHELYRHEWVEPECSCVTPSQSCPACRLAAAQPYQDQIPY